MTHHLQLRSVSGLATCDVCRTLISFEVPRGAIEHFEGVRCPLCKGSAEIHRGTVVPVLEVAAHVTGGLE